MATAYEAHERRASDSGLRASRLTEFSTAAFPELRPPPLVYLISAIRMMMGIGTPSSHNKAERMIAS
jgi:hypothetical protein